MIKLLRYLKKRDWFLIVIILALAFLQVYCSTIQLFTVRAFFHSPFILQTLPSSYSKYGDGRVFLII